ncbi:hypothetical protein GF407_01575 [candidate division KSB1 bacterium]|nr:hypothetical protein [candidate division KSB1 bacterium]
MHFGIENAPAAEEGESLNLNCVFWVDESHGGFSTNASRFLYTTNGGDAWNALTIPVLPAAQKLVFNGNGQGIAAHWQGGMVESADCGNHWQEIFPPQEGIVRQVYAHNGFSGWSLTALYMCVWIQCKPGNRSILRMLQSGIWK